MKLSNEDLTDLIYIIDAWKDGSHNVSRLTKLLKKLSKELAKRGFTTLISKHYIGDEE